MKKLIFLLFLIPHFLHAQANIAGLLYASNFAGWSVPQGNQGLMSWTSPSFCTVTSGGATFRAFAVGVPVTLNDAEVPSNTEVITPIQANYSGFGCSISATMTHPHKSFYFTTATAGLGEAITFAGSAKYQVVLTPDWTRLGGTTSTVTSSTVGNTNVTILDQRTADLSYYTWSGSAYVNSTFGGSLPTASTAGQVPTSTGPGPIYTAQTPAGTTPLWQRAGVVLTPIPTDLSQQVQEISGLLSASPEVLTGCTQVLKVAFTAGWLTSTVQLWSAESCDGIHFTRAPAPIPSTVDYARSFVMPNLISGNIVMYALNTTNNQIDMFTGTTMAGLTKVHTNVLSCGAHGDQASTQGTFTPWVISGNNWAGLQGCLTTTNNYAQWSVSSADGGVTWTNFQSGAVIGDTGVTCGGNCTDAGDRGIYYDGTKAYFWAHTGPAGILPTPYIWEFVSADGTGHSWTAMPNPSITSISNLEGVNLPTTGTAGPQLGDVFVVNWPTLGRTFMYYATYAPGCAASTCTIPSYIEVATIPLPIATIAPLQQSDGPYTVGSPLFQVNSTPQSNPWRHNLVAGTGITLTDSGNGSVVVSLTPTFQDQATFNPCTSGTLLSAYTTTAGKTFAEYSNDGVSTTIPQCTGSSTANQPAGTVSNFSSGLDSLTPASANYTVSGTFTINTSGAQVVVFARANSAASTNYQFECTQGGNCNLYEVLTGSATQIGSGYSSGWAVNGTHTMTITVNGTAISAGFDGTTVQSGTNSGVSAAGQAGFRVTGGNSANISNFSIQ